MAEQRKGTGFPLVGDKALADDGSVWEFVQDQEDGADVGDPHWRQLDAALSVAELDRAEQTEKGMLDRLRQDHGVYALAFGGVKLVKREQDLQDLDPKEQFILALATASLRDSIIALTSEDHQRTDLEASALARFRGMLGGPELAQVEAELAALRQRVADQAAPDGVAAKAREPMTELAELAGKLPMDSDARNTITTIATSRKPLPETPDKLFRELVTLGVDVETAKKAHGAAASIVRAHG